MSPVSTITEKGRVRVTVTAIAGSLVTVTRRHPSGRVVPVRGMTLLPLSGGVAIGWDYEMPIGVTVEYTAQAFDAGDLETPLETSDPVTVTWPFTTEWLKDPLEPLRNMPVTIGDMSKYTYQSRTGVHAVLGRPAPITVGEVRSAATDAVEILTYTKEERDRLHYITASGNVLLLQSTQESGIGNMYLALLNVEESRVIPTRASLVRRWTLEYQEVDAPVGAPAPFTTYTDLAGLVPTYQALRDNYTSYFDVIESIDRASPPPTITWRGA